MTDDKDNTVVSLVGRTANDLDSKDCIEFMETWMELVKSGEITDVAIIALGKSGRTLYGHSTTDQMTIIGVLEVLKTDLIQDFQIDYDPDLGQE